MKATISASLTIDAIKKIEFFTKKLDIRKSIFIEKAILEYLEKLEKGDKNE
jgi:hypothetical protein